MVHAQTQLDRWEASRHKSVRARWPCIYKLLLFYRLSVALGGSHAGLDPPSGRHVRDGLASWAYMARSSSEISLNDGRAFWSWAQQRSMRARHAGSHHAGMVGRRVLLTMPPMMAPWCMSAYGSSPVSSSHSTMPNEKTSTCNAAPVSQRALAASLACGAQHARAMQEQAHAGGCGWGR